MSKSQSKKEQTCQRKLLHEDYWQALQHARALRDDGLEIYPCRICGFLHIGHTRPRYARHCAREGQARERRLLKKIQIHLHLRQRYLAMAARHQRLASRFQNQLESDLAFYNSGTLHE